MRRLPNVDSREHPGTHYDIPTPPGAGRRCVRQTSSLAVAKAAADDRPFFGVLWADLVEKRINVRRSLANHDELNRDQPTESENCYNGLEPDVVP
ncbi:hypothetical protein CTAM01_12989 [Colletotrichum tamarilloi]|uniref:Uncharacterized protein n=1 Tax=Colletotrichum tamarilloi TaxID=1209934 RepID=A0ABQ9QTB3_9PEZI|nr:uncharacterized protein CTAM01_12989 [Colletotrichum tamarilloi]KAK1484484.1 hypothetical protein CTAM01_12989 [Colletotrichum tamarilloi]